MHTYMEYPSAYIGYGLNTLACQAKHSKASWSRAASIGPNRRDLYELWSPIDKEVVPLAAVARLVHSVASAASAAASSRIARRPGRPSAWSPAPIQHAVASVRAWATRAGIVLWLRVKDWVKAEAKCNHCGAAMPLAQLLHEQLSENGCRRLQRLHEEEALEFASCAMLGAYARCELQWDLWMWASGTYPDCWYQLSCQPAASFVACCTLVASVIP